MSVYPLIEYFDLALENLYSLRNTGRHTLTPLLALQDELLNRIYPMPGKRLIDQAIRLK